MLQCLEHEQYQQLAVRLLTLTVKCICWMILKLKIGQEPYLKRHARVMLHVQSCWHIRLASGLNEMS